MFLFFDFFSRAFNFDAQAVQPRDDAQRERQRIAARRQRRQAAEAACRAH
ncbi:hypothetical protein OU800_20140 [Pseudomonas sp. GOM7]|nr:MULTISPECIES: hypothetical protein [unclassified Pseudomonas]WAJ36890.1 hypothetical protein OU800_20140 [Pseudomonas sp. GOM7]